MPRITPGKLYNVPNAGAFRRGGPLATDHWEVLDKEKTTVIARFETGALCRGYLNAVRAAVENDRAKTLEKLHLLGKRTLSTKNPLLQKELVQFEGANKRTPKGEAPAAGAEGEAARE
mgnify:FL=1